MVNIFDLNLDEKYKPKTADELVGQPQVQSKIKNWVAVGRVPHLLFVGPPGVGKTSAARALARDLYGESIWQYNLHEFNASTTRGIDFIRGDVQRLVDIMPVDAPYQIIFLDEADELTIDAQTALRQVMMKHTDTSKFILSCNYPHKIIGPIKDRCAVLRFKPLALDIITSRLKIICDNEHIMYDAGVPEVIAKCSNGSLRKAVQNLEVYCDKNNFISLAAVQSDVAAIEAQDMSLLLQRALDGDVEGYEKQLFTLYYDGGFCAAEMLSALLGEIGRKRFDVNTKMALINLTGEYDWRISQGSNELLQMRCYLNALHAIANKMK